MSKLFNVLIVLNKRINMTKKNYFTLFNFFISILLLILFLFLYYSFFYILFLMF
jgi:hypothetical protein